MQTTDLLHASRSALTNEIAEVISDTLLCEGARAGCIILVAIPAIHETLDAIYYLAQLGEQPFAQPLLGAHIEVAAQQYVTNHQPTQGTVDVMHGNIMLCGSSLFTRVQYLRDCSDTERLHAIGNADRFLPLDIRVGMHAIQEYCVVQDDAVLIDFFNLARRHLGIHACTLHEEIHRRDLMLRQELIVGICALWTKFIEVNKDVQHAMCLRADMDTVAQHVALATLSAFERAELVRLIEAMRPKVVLAVLFNMHREQSVYTKSSMPGQYVLVDKFISWMRAFLKAFDAARP